MSIKLTHPQAECIRMIRRGVNTSPPLKHSVVAALKQKRMIEEYRVGGLVCYRETELGKRF